MAIARIGAAVRAALSRGAAGSVARRIFRGFAVTEIRDFLSRRFGLAPAVQQDEVLRRGVLAREAGQLAMELAQDQRLPLRDIPINRFISPELAQGGRLLTEATIPWFRSETGTEGAFDTRFISTGVLTPAEIETLAAEFVGVLQDPQQYPGLLERLGTEEIVIGQVEVPSLERIF